MTSQPTSSVYCGTGSMSASATLEVILFGGGGGLQNGRKHVLKLLLEKENMIKGHDLCDSKRTMTHSCENVNEPSVS
jgi:hypothetical protein